MSEPVSADTKGTILWICESGVELPSMPGFGISGLKYSFTDHDRGDGFSAWQIGAGSSASRVEVLESCRSCQGGFRQQALNRFVAQKIMSLRPGLLVVDGLWGCTLDLPRLSSMLGIPCLLFFSGLPVEDVEGDRFLGYWLEDAIDACFAVASDETDTSGLTRLISTSRQVYSLQRQQLGTLVDSLLPEAPSTPDFDYSLYELLLRDHPLLVRMQEQESRHFEGLASVLDVGCGVGLFLDLLRRSNVNAVGIERNQAVSRYARGLGLNVQTGDALEVMQELKDEFDGIYCSHFVEHLPTEAVHRLLQLINERLKPGGVLVLVFPDPESIRSQLLGFWRDPEHVRFYHPELITSMAAAVGLELEWSSYQEQPHHVAPFASQPPDIDLSGLALTTEPPVAFEEASMLDRVLAAVGLVPRRRLAGLEGRLTALEAAATRLALDQAEIIGALEWRTRELWEVNQTWSWNDNVTLRLRKRVGTV